MYIHMNVSKVGVVGTANIKQKKKETLPNRFLISFFKLTLLFIHIFEEKKKNIYIIRTVAGTFLHGNHFTKLILRICRDKFKKKRFYSWFGDCDVAVALRLRTWKERQQVHAFNSGVALVNCGPEHIHIVYVKAVISKVSPAY